MSSCAEDLIVSPVGLYGKFWRLRQEFIVEVDGERDIVPQDFLTDFASTQVPRLLLPGASAYHDWLYWEQKYSRLRCDQLFMKYMITKRVNFIIRWAFYLGCRLFGWAAWWRNKWLKGRGVRRPE